MKISVITVSYNAAGTIADALSSVAAQEYRDIEHIVVDGASSDGTQDVVSRYSERVSQFVSERDGGIYDAMNKGLRLVTGQVVGFLNADDLYPDTRTLTHVAEAFASHSIDACYGDLCYVDPLRLDRVVRYWRSSPFRPGSFARGWVPPHPTFFVRRKVYQSRGGFDTSYRLAADFELMLRFLEVGRVHSRYIPRVMVKMRLGGATNKNWRNVLRQNREIVRALRHHGMEISLPRLAVSKAASRAIQFIHRPV